MRFEVNWTSIDPIIPKYCICGKRIDPKHAFGFYVFREHSAMFWYFCDWECYNKFVDVVTKDYDSLEDWAHDQALDHSSILTKDLRYRNDKT